jgi:hypothetical protein
MAASTWKLGDGTQNKSVNTESKNSKNTGSIVISDQGNQRKLVCEEDLLELKFDIDEMQELFTMSTHPHVRSLLLSLINELQNTMKNIKV